MEREDLTRTWRCPDEADIAAYLDRRLDGPSRERVERHLAGCGHCLAQVAGVVRSQDASDEVPPALLARARGLVPAPARRPAWRWSAIAATACIAAVATFITWQPRFHAVPEGAAVRSVSRPTAPPAVLSPKEGSAIPRGDLELRWSPAEGALYYTVRVLSADGDVIWESRAESTELRVPGEVNLTAGHEYYVSVSALLQDGKSLRSPASTFRVNGQ